ncbi:MAG: hypothetical protein DMF77_18985 [Acidobacteria bacterium]|nr:MAG: hypothetical protein DMF77_18985 [Acidobacteriota bacterium]
MRSASWRRSRPAGEAGAAGGLTLRIGIVTPYDLADEGGVKRHVLHLAEGLRRGGDDVTVLGPLRAGARVDGVCGFGGVVDIPANGASNRLALFTSPWTLRRFFDAHPFDVVHVHEPYVPLLTYYAMWMTPAAAHVATFHMYPNPPRPSPPARAPAPWP